MYTTKYLNSGKGSAEATGGSEWQKYMHPKYQRRMFFPDLWEKEELDKYDLKQIPEVNGGFIAMDPPKHDEQRRVVSPVVAPPNLAKMESLIRSRVIAILEGLPVGEEFNWVDKVSIELTTQMLATLFDFPFEDRHMLTRWSDVATSPRKAGLWNTLEERQAELDDCLQYMTRLRNERAEDPGGHDLLTMLANNEGTKNMPPSEFLGNLLLLIIGGNDTTRNSISGGVLAMNRFPDQFEKIKAGMAMYLLMFFNLFRLTVNLWRFSKNGVHIE